MVVVGVDEAGRGCSFGSIWAGACVIPEGVVIAGLTDSKKLSPARRRAMMPKIKSMCPYGLGEVTCAEIDQMGIDKANVLAFHRALDDLVHRNAELSADKISKVLVDGNLFRAWRGRPFSAEPKADQRYKEVSGASVLAKETRDKQVEELGRQEHYKPYGIEKHKGYQTKVHIEALRRLGRSDLHRKSFRVSGLD